MTHKLRSNLIEEIYEAVKTFGGLTLPDSPPFLILACQKKLCAAPAGQTCCNSDFQLQLLQKNRARWKCSVPVHRSYLHACSSVRRDAHFLAYEGRGNSW